MKNLKFILVVGLPFSEKDKICKELAKKYNAEILTSYDQYINKKWDNSTYVVNILSTTIKLRKKFFDSISNIECEKICYIINTPYDDCKKNITKSKNTNKISMLKELDDVYKEFEIPFKNEGFDEINIYDIPTEYNKDKRLKLIQELFEYSQNSQYHKYTIGEHSYNLGEKLKEYDRWDLYEAALWHDIGKPFTRTYDLQDGFCHYINHQNVSAYFMLTNLDILPFNCDMLYIIQIINYHMIPFNFNSDKIKMKWKKIFGDKLYADLILFNKCDKLSR